MVPIKKKKECGFWAKIEFENSLKMQKKLFLENQRGGTTFSQYDPFRIISHGNELLFLKVK